jgi:hypothetical protein
MVAFIQGTWLYLSGIQADEAQLAIFDSPLPVVIRLVVFQSVNISHDT